MAINKKTTETLHSDFLSGLTIAQKITFCDLKFDDLGDTKAALKIRFKQKTIARELAQVFAQGNKDVSPDQWKAAKYRAKATSPHHEEVKTPANTTLNTTNAYDKLRWLTRARLFLVRANRVANALKVGFLTNPVARKIMNILSLSTGVELLVDIGVILYTTFRSEKTPLSRWARFKNVLFKDDRPNRMANALVTFAINLTTLLVTGGSIIGPWIIALNVVGYTLDVILDVRRSNANYHQRTTLLDSIRSKVEGSKKNGVTKDSLKLIEQATSKEADKFYAERKYVLTNSALTFTAMCLVVLSTPASTPFIIASVIALLSASVFTGLGRGLLQLYRSSYPATPASSPTPPLNNANPIQRAITINSNHSVSAKLPTIKKSEPTASCLYRFFSGSTTSTNTKPPTPLLSTSVRRLPIRQCR